MSPAVSKKQRQAMAIAEHGGGKPGEPSAEMAKSMSKKTLHEFAATPEKGLPEHKAPKKHGKHDVTVLKAEKVRHVK